MISENINLDEEWQNYIKSHKEVPVPRHIFMNGAFAVYRMLITAEDQQNKLREVMYRLGEQFRKEFK